MKYPNLEKHLKDKNLKAKEKVKLKKDFQTLSVKEKYEILEKIARDLGYIE
mgnify:CR=1 FL=1